ncbi:YfhE family protein [Thalassobacillus devorans]|uniref:YfhE family protein n=1 Tax=Thalassobacillus devorans TaxID=279813 RepID=UPI0004BAD1E5|nr:YfhE family protein [Thalassobacillus devorans]
MARKAQYQPVGGNGIDPTDAQEVHYAKEFKQADKAGGYRKQKVKEAKRENPDLKQ